MTWRRSALHIALTLSLCVNIWVGYRVFKLDATVRALTERPGLQVGSEVPDLDLVTTAGQTVTIRYSDAPLPTVLYIVSPACGWCARNLPNVTAFARSLHNRVRFVGVSIPLTSRAVETPPVVPATEDLTFPVYTGLSDAARKALRVKSTPATILIARTGVVLGVWEGAYAGQTKAALERYFRISLPDFVER